MQSTAYPFELLPLSVRSNDDEERRKVVSCRSIQCCVPRMQSLHVNNRQGFKSRGVGTLYLHILPPLSIVIPVYVSLVETILYGAQMSGPHLLKIKRNVYDCHLLQHDGNLKIPILYVGCLSVILRAVLLIHFIITSRLVPVSRTGV